MNLFLPYHVIEGYVEIYVKEQSFTTANKENMENLMNESIFAISCYSGLFIRTLYRFTLQKSVSCHDVIN